MGRDVTHIIRNDFHDITNFEAAQEYAEKTIARLKKELYLYGLDGEWEMRDEYNRIFMMPLYHLKFTLHNGFWAIESYYHYCQIVMHKGNHFWLRRMIYDIARALGQEEAWHADEGYTWNGGPLDDDDTTCTLEEWIDFAKKKYEEDIPEFDHEAILAQGDVHIPEYENIYHDTFKDCRELYDKESARFKDSRLIGITMFEYTYRVERKDGVYFINAETGEELFDFPVLTLLQNNEIGIFIVKKDGLTAMFDHDKKQLTPFVAGQFEWKWSENKKTNQYYRTIFNKEAGISMDVK